MNDEQQQSVLNIVEGLLQAHAGVVGRLLVMDSALNALIDRTDDPQALRDELLRSFLPFLNGEKAQRQPKMTAGIRDALSHLGCEPPGPAHR